MRGWASYLSLLGGRAALSPLGIALVVTVMFGLTMISGWGPFADPTADLHFLPNLLAHVLLAGVALLMWWLLYFLPQQPPPAVVTLGLFVALAIVRIYAVDFSYLLVGVEPLEATPVRLALSIGLSVPLLALTGVVTELLQQSRSARRRIDQAEESISSLGQSGQSARELTVAEVMARAQAHVDQLLLPWRVSVPRRPAVVAGEIDRLVQKVIRPLSHETKLPDSRTDHNSASKGAHTVEALASSADDPEALLPKDLRWREILPTNGASTVVVALPITLLFMWERFGWSIEAVLAVATLPLLGGSLWLLRRVVSRSQPRTATTRFIWIVAGMIVAGAASAALLVVSARFAGNPVDFVFAAPVLAAILGIGFSLAEHLLSVALMRERVRAKSLAALASRTARLQGSGQDGRAQAADLLHSGVQAELVAWAALFRSAKFDPKQLPAALEEMGQRLDRLFDDLPDGDVEAAESRFDSLVTVWSAARPITHTVAPEVWSVLDRDPALADHTFLVLSEALSNAVRHGEDGDIVLTLRQERSGTLELRVSNPGVLYRVGPAAVAGMGLVTIGEHSRDAQLEQHGDRVVLAVRFSTGDFSNRDLTKSDTATQ